MNFERLIRKIGDPGKRSTWQIIGFIILIPVILCWFLWSSFIEKPPAPLTPDEALLEAVLLDTADFPAPWSPEDIDTERVSVPNGIGKTLWFRQFFDRPWINIGEEVYVYQSAEAARHGYRAQLSKYARFELQGWEAVSEFSFSPHADEIHPSCTEGYINGQHHFPCSVVGQYGRVVIVVSGNIFDKRWLTADQFRQVLITADRKANLSRHKQ